MIKRSLLTAACTLVLLAASPTPTPFVPQLPDKPLHVKLLVEVNRHGQVVRIEHGTLSGDRAFDTMTLGNAMQMWIRRPDGSAVTGRYWVRYDYDNRTHEVHRTPALASTGGSWANAPGAATLIMSEARKQAKREYERLRAEQQKAQAEHAKHLPDINAAVKRAMRSPSPSPQP